MISADELLVDVEGLTPSDRVRRVIEVARGLTADHRATLLAELGARDRYARQLAVTMAGATGETPHLAMAVHLAGAVNETAGWPEPWRARIRALRRHPEVEACHAARGVHRLGVSAHRGVATGTAMGSVAGVHW